MVCSLSLKNVRNLDKWRAKEVAGLKKQQLSTVNQQCHVLKKYCSLKPHQKWSPWKGGCEDAILKVRKQGEKAE